jgi:hypothetical protein
VAKEDALSGDIEQVGIGVGAKMTRVTRELEREIRHNGKRCGDHADEAQYYGPCSPRLIDYS